MTLNQNLSNIKRGVKAGYGRRERVLLKDNPGIYCLIIRKTLLFLEVLIVKVNVCNTILLIPTGNPCSPPFTFSLCFGQI